MPPEVAQAQNGARSAIRVKARLSDWTLAFRSTARDGCSEVHLPLPFAKPRRRTGATCCITTDFAETGRPDFDRFAEGIAIPPRLSQAKRGRRREFIAGRACAREALRAWTDMGIVSMGGAGEPQWPAGYTGSIAHCGAHAIAVAAPDHCASALGIDLERKLTREEAFDIAPLVLSREERGLLGTRRDTDTLSLIFSAKESLFKALFRRTGQIAFFKAYQLRSLRKGQAEFTLLKEHSPGWHRSASITVQLGELNGQFATFVAVEPN